MVPTGHFLKVLGRKKNQAKNWIPRPELHRRMCSKFILLVWCEISKLRIYRNLVKDHWNPTGSSTRKYKTSQQEFLHNPGHSGFQRPDTPEEEELSIRNRQTLWIKLSDTRVRRHHKREFSFASRSAKQWSFTWEQAGRTRHIRTRANITASKCMCGYVL